MQAPDKRHALLSHGDGHLEVWMYRVGQERTIAPDLYVLKFPGTASRAEDSADFVECCWPDRWCVEIWAVNPPGYGSSSGRASLRHIPAMARRAFEEIRQAKEKRPLIVAGGSLGCVSALYLAANHPVDGLLLQNPPALREVIEGQTVRWCPKWLTRALAHQIPEHLDSIRNAARIQVPAVFVMALRDRVVPARFQQQIIEAYDAPKRVLGMPEADHDTPLSERDLEQLRPLVNWLGETTLH